jgi:bifunctional non-homologous end joining protein LigD
VPELRTYRAKRDAKRTPEPVPPPGPLPAGGNDTFVIQEHHARSLHWDLRLERDGVLVSWAVPKGLPTDPKTNHLAVHTEDHPIEYAGFAGEIPAGEYGAGSMSIWDRGHYDTEKWTDREVKVVLRGARAQGRYVLFRTRGKNWMIHRMDPPPEGTEPVPEHLRPMLAVPGELPTGAGWAYEFKWDGVRALVRIEGGRPAIRSRNDRDITASYPELRALAEKLGARQVLLDGEIVALDNDGRPSFGALQPRMHVTKDSQVRRLMAEIPVSYLIFDVLHLDGRPTIGLPYAERRKLLEGLELSGPCWQTPPSFSDDGAAVLEVARQRGLEGIVAKRLTAPYLPGRRSDTWRKVKLFRTQEVVVGGWKPGEGRRAGTLGSLLLGLPDGRGGLDFVGHVGTGFTDRVLAELMAELAPLEQPDLPFTGPVPKEHIRGARWVAPRLVGEVRFAEWTRDGRLRAPSWRGLRPDKDPGEVVRES